MALTFIEYLREKIHPDNCVSIKNNRIILKEEHSDSKLKEIIVNFDSKKYDTFLMTLDENNLSIQQKRKMFPYFKEDICSSVDYVLFVNEKNTEDYFNFHIELKSQKPENREILKKHITSQKIIKFILTALYLKNLKEYRNIGQKIKFPKQFYESTIVLYKSNLSGTKQEIKEKQYKMEPYKGCISEKWSYYTKGLAVASGQSRVNLKEFLVYFKKNILQSKNEICYELYLNT